MRQLLQRKSRKYCIFRKCVFVTALGVQYAMRMRHIVSCGLSGSAIFFPHYPINGTIFEKKKVIEHKMCVLISSTTFA